MVGNRFCSFVDIPYLCFSTWPGRLLVEISPRKACLFVCSFTGLMPVGCGMKVMAEQCYYYDTTVQRGSLLDLINW